MDRHTALTTRPGAPRQPQGWHSVIGPAEYPFLAKQLGGPERDVVLAELERLVGRFWRARAERFDAEVLAKLVFADRPDEPLTVTVHDVSATGIRVTVPFGVELDVMTSRSVGFLLRAEAPEGPRLFRLAARLVRVAGTDDAGVQLGFEFGGVGAEDRELLGELTNVHAA